MTDYEMLKAHGHSAFKALEIVTGAKQGDAYSKAWIEKIKAAQGATP